MNSKLSPCDESPPATPQSPASAAGPLVAGGPLRAARLRYEPIPQDRLAVRRIVQSTGFFTPAETNVAVELVDERLAKGRASGYYFVFADQDQTVGYACYGPIACTVASFDLFWIAVQPSAQGQGLGRMLLAEAERLVREQSGRRVYAETSSRPQYASTRAFYERCGYQRAATLKDFYAPGDDKVIYLKVLDPPTTEQQP